MEWSKRGMLVLLSALVIGALTLGGCAPLQAISGQKQQLTDYSGVESWMETSAGIKDVDCFFIYPTVTLEPENGSQNISIENLTHRDKAKFCVVAQASVFEDSCNIYAPYYRQVNMQTYALPKEEMAAALEIAYEDVKAAFLYFIEHFNNDRPFIIAGHSQGSIMTMKLLEDVMKDAELSKRMVAAYAIGFPITQEYLDANPHLKFAEGADDTGVIVSFNTCSETAVEQTALKGGLCINPINWKRDETAASASENMGSVFFDENTYDRIEVEGYANAVLDNENGVVICSTITDNNKYAITAPKFADDVYHMTEYGFYYNNLRQNVANRIEHYWHP